MGDSTYIESIRAHRTELGSNLLEAKRAVDGGWRPKPGTRPYQELVAKLAEADRKVAAPLAFHDEQARLEKARGIIRDLAADLEAEINARAPSELPRRIERDLEPVRRAADFLKSMEPKP